jgi:5-methylcytosine-specific restriction endonuclease McrA
MLKSCKYCGRIHDSKYDCGKKPKPIYKRTESEQGRYTTAWHKKSIEIKERSQYLCAVCRDKGIYTYDDLEVHHIEPLREHPDLLLEDSNLICLCERCHEKAERGKIDKVYLKLLVHNRDNPPTSN